MKNIQMTFAFELINIYYISVNNAVYRVFIVYTMLHKPSISDKLN